MKLYKHSVRVSAFVFALGLVAAACGGGDDDDDAPSGGNGGNGGNAGSGGNRAGSGGGGQGGSGGSDTSGGMGGTDNMGGGGEPPGIVDVPLVGHWKFDDDTMDSSGKGNHGVSVKGNRADAAFKEPTFVAGKWGKAIDLGGNPAQDIAGVTEWEWVRVDSSDSINETGVNGSFTVAAWVYVKTFDETADDFNFVIARQELGTAFNHFALGLLAGTPSLVVHFFTASGPNALAPGEWHHIAGTYDRIEQTVYADGELVASASIGWPIAADSTLTIIGADQNIEAVKEGFSGLLDDVRLYAEALTPAQIKTIMGR